MKKLTILAAVAMIALCTSAMAITITVSGTITIDGVPAEATSMGPDWDYEDVGVNPLIEIMVNGGLVGQTTVGAGQYVLPVGGMYTKGLDVGALNVGDIISIRAYASADGSGPSADSAGIAYSISDPPAPADSVFAGLDANVAAIPEPTMMLSGLALLLLRRKK